MMNDFSNIQLKKYRTSITCWILIHVSIRKLRSRRKRINFRIFKGFQKKIICYTLKEKMVARALTSKLLQVFKQTVEIADSLSALHLIVKCSSKNFPSLQYFRRVRFFIAIFCGRNCRHHLPPVFQPFQAHLGAITYTRSGI